METGPPRRNSELREALVRWDRHAAPTLSAALAFYVLISIAPLSVIAVGLIGQALGEASVRAFVAESARHLFDPVTADLISDILATPWVRRSNWVGNVAAGLMVLLASTAGVNNLRGSLNRIFESSTPPIGLVREILRGRALSLVVVLVFGVTILASLALRTALATMSSWIDLLPVAPALPLAWLPVLEILVTFVVLTGLFTLVFRILPDRKLPLRVILTGATTTSVLFLLGEWLIGQYLGHVSLASAFGVAGSSVVLAAWVYYSSMVFFFGAALTAVRADTEDERNGGDAATGSP
jgi:membrane protein